MSNATWRRNGLFNVIACSLEFRTVTQVRKLEAGTQAEAVEAFCLLDCSSMTCSSCFLVAPRTTCSEPTLPTVRRSLLHQFPVRKSSTGLSVVQENEGIFAVQVPSSKITLSSVSWHWTSQHRLRFQMRASSLSSSIMDPVVHVCGFSNKVLKRQPANDGGKFGQANR